MIDLKLITSRLPKVFTHPVDAMRSVIATARIAMADKEVSLIREYIDQRRPFKQHTGNLREGVTWRMRGGRPVVTIIGPGEHYWQYVEYGTRPHVINPKKPGGVLVFESNGRTVFAKTVNHPGSKPRPFITADREHRRRELIKEAAAVVAKEIMKK